MIVQGDIYLAQLNPTKKHEIGKLRPCIILTANQILQHSSTNLFVCPLSSQSTSALRALHITIPPRDQLKVTSYAIVEQIRAVSEKRLVGKRIASLTHQEVSRIIKKLIVMIHPGTSPAFIKHEPV